MIQYRKILVPTDGTRDVKSAISFALNMAKITGAKVTAMCVNDVSNYAVPGDSDLLDVDSPHFKSCEKAVKVVADLGDRVGVPVNPLVVSGIPAKVIIDCSGEYDLIIMGTAGRSGVNLLLLGSIAQKVIRFASCPVLVIRGDQPGELHCNRILIPTDGTKITHNAISHGLEMAQIFKANVTALSVSSVRKIPIPFGGSGNLFFSESGQEAVDEVVEQGRRNGIEVIPMVVMGSVANEIIKASGQHDLLVMGTSGRTGLEYLRLGSVAEKTVRHARCPVFVVKGFDTVHLEK